MEDSAEPQASDQPRSPDAALVKFARPALIAGSAVAVVCIALLVIIFFLDAFNATVYSVGGNNIQDATAEAENIRGLYTGARAGATAVLVFALLSAAAGAVVMYRTRGPGSYADNDGDDEVDFDDLAGR